MKYDIAIVGGGMVGAALACALGDTPLRIALIDAAASHANDHRLIALNYASCEFFKKLTIWPTLAPHASAIQEVHVSNRGHFGTTRLRAKEMGVEQLGHVVPARDINTALYARLDELENIEILRGAKLTALFQHNTHVDLTLQLESGQELIEAAIVIGADGTFSTVRELLQIPVETMDYQQKALVTITELQRSHHHIAYERFLPNGAIAMLPLTEQRAATIWSGDDKTIDELLTLSDTEFLEKLQENFGFRLGKLLKTQQRFSYPLKFIKAKEQIKNNVILIGNAAHTVHPIAAQGLNLALYEVEILADHFRPRHCERSEAIQTTCIDKEKLDCFAALAMTEVTVESNADRPLYLSLNNLPDFFTQQTLSMNLSHRLTQLFSTDFFGLTTAKQLGMMGLDLCTFAKKRFGKRVLGLKKPINKII